MRRLLLILGISSLAACPPPAASPDGGVELDPGALPDAGVIPDAGPVIEDSGIPDAGFGPVAIERWCESLAFAECARDVRCLKLEQNRFARCLARRQEACDQAAYSQAVAGGRLQYVASQGATCLNGYGQGSCSAAPAECEALFLGLVPADGGCLLPQECDPSGFCFTYTTSCPFRCYGYRSLGESCNGWDQRCKPGQGTCQLDGGVHACAPPRGVSQPCTSQECREDLTCYNNKCVKLAANLGEPCGETGPFPSCPPDAFCRQPPAPPGGQAPPGTCQRRVGLGGVCAMVGYVSSCLTNLRCSSLYQTGTCIPLGSEGDTCAGFSWFSDCRDELFCATRTSTCTALPGDGGDCTSRGSNFKCAVGHFCDYFGPGQQYPCTAKRALGEICSYAGACLSSDCKYGPLSDGGYGSRCVPPCSHRVDGGF